MSVKAEEQVIGCLLLDHNSIQGITDILTAEMFENDLYGRFYVEFLRGYDNGYEVNLVVLNQKLESSDYPQDIVMEEITNAVSSVPVSANIESYANVIVNDYKVRQANKILNSIQFTPDGIERQIGKLIEEFEVLTGTREIVSNTLSELSEMYEKEYFNDDIEDSKVMCGISDIDEILGGFEKGEVYVIGARPSVGKSALVTQIATTMESQNKRVGFYSLEMNDKSLYERFIANASGISLTRLKRAKYFLGDEKQRFENGNAILRQKKNLHIFAKPMSAKAIQRSAKNMDFDCVIIDYLQIVDTDSTYRGNRVQEISEMSREFKKMAMSYNIPIIILSQLNRGVELREDKKPTLADLRESGAIEQDATSVIFLYRPDEENPNKRGVSVAKNRQGQIGEFELDFSPEFMKFTSRSDWRNTDDDNFEQDEMPF